MKEQLTYSNRYDPHFGFKYKEPYPDAEVRKRVKMGKPLAAVIGDPQKPRCFIDIAPNSGFHGVSFVDDQMRVFLVYFFCLQDDGSLFMEQLIERKFHEGTKDVKFATQMFFKKDGNIHIIQTDLVTKTEDSWDTVNDVSVNYEPFPVFGEYDSITRLER